MCIRDRLPAALPLEQAEQEIEALPADPDAVSYTHLDVYKRQAQRTAKGQMP